MTNEFKHERLQIRVRAGPRPTWVLITQPARSIEVHIPIVDRHLTSHFERAPMLQFNNCCNFFGKYSSQIAIIVIESAVIKKMPTSSLVKLCSVSI